jgi:hypothetical protein
VFAPPAADDQNFHALPFLSFEKSISRMLKQVRM